MNIYLNILWIYFIYFLQVKSNISKLKCKEYSKYVYSNISSPLLIGNHNANNNNNNNNNNNQIQVSECNIVAVPLIIRGTKANKKEFPHMAQLGYGFNVNNITAWLCGGSLISDRFILTAAHCKQQNQIGDAQKVRLGMINLIEKSVNNQEKIIIEKFLHPNYSSITGFNDIALFLLDSSVRFSSYVRPACIGSILNEIPNIAIATGFGKLNLDDHTVSLNLMKVSLPILTNDKCNKVHKYNAPRDVIINDNIICAGEINGKDTCQGDSGGPLQIVLNQPYCMYNIIGVTSMGKLCGYVPAIYTNVNNYLSWIENIVWK